MNDTIQPANPYTLTRDGFTVSKYRGNRRRSGGASAAMVRRQHDQLPHGKKDVIFVTKRRLAPLENQTAILGFGQLFLFFRPAAARFWPLHCDRGSGVAKM
jgi:hypothetical protein